jgi:peptide/nickel transport system substrate-binding protein
MIDRTTKLRWRRRVRRRQKQFEDIGSQTDESLDKHFFRRLGRLYEVRRFILTWILLLISLISAVVIQTRALGDHYLTVVPVPGGIYSEGIIGSYTNANPIFATTDVDSSVSRLIFSGLLTYNDDNQLVGDLAKSWTVDEEGKVYSFTLRDDITWHDGQAFRADDVVFTFETIQNPDARSPLFAGWSGIKVTAQDPLTVNFTLPNVLASFPYSLTTGILPRHKLQDMEAAELRGALFNTIEPVGTGPFKWNGVEVRGDTAENREQRIALVANERYHKGKPHLSEFILRAYLNESSLTDSFYKGELNAVAGSQTMSLDTPMAEELNIPLTGSVMVFLKTTQPNLKESKVRRALAHATNQKELLRQLRLPSKAVDGPLLAEHIGYKPALGQVNFDLTQANALLTEAGWQLDPATNIRTKDGEKLTINLNTLNSSEYASVANQLQKQWRAVGVDLIVNSLPQRDLQTVIEERSYDALMYGIVMGLDPDQFAYWHSTQADVRSQRRLNFSDYSSNVVDSALEAGRTRIDPNLRAAKYEPFLQTWRDDAPAIALYRPRFLYTTYGKLYNFNHIGLNSPIDRYNSIEKWMIRTDRAIE